MKKTFVLDTNVILTDPRAIFRFKCGDIVIPISVIEEVDYFKKHMSELGRNAREFSRIVDRLRAKGSLATGVRLSEKRNAGVLRVLFHEGDDPSGLNPALVDNRILGLALRLSQREKRSRVVVISRDANLRIKADALGLEAQDYTAERPLNDEDEPYAGRVEVRLTGGQIQELMTRGEIRQLKEGALKVNQFVSLMNGTGEEMGQGIVTPNGTIKKIDLVRLSAWGIEPRNVEQAFVLKALLDPAINLVTITGSAGTGKTLLAIAAGIEQVLERQRYNKLMVARPIVTLGKDLGYLPGDVSEKLQPWMLPIFDNLELIFSRDEMSRERGRKPHGGSAVRPWEEFVHRGLLSVEPLTYIRGRTLPGLFFLIDEAQNLTPHEIKTIVTRAGEGTKIVFTGDPEQIDNPYLDSQNNGLVYLLERFKGEKLAAHISLSRGERSALATLGAKLL